MNSTTKIGSMFLLAAILVVGTVAMTIPSSFAEPEYREYKDPYAKEYKSYPDPHEKKYSKDPRGDGEIIWDKDRKGASVQSIKCVNSNININDVDVGKYANGLGADATAAEALQGDENGLTQGTGNGISGNGGIDIERNLVNVCLDINLNAQNDELLGLLF